MKRSLRNRGFGFAFGLFAFASAHAWAVAMWTQWFGAAHVPWFLNSGKAIGFTVGWMLVLSAVGGAIALSGGMIFAGAVCAMAIVLVWTGQGTLLPIALAMGAAFLAFSCLLGAWLGKEAVALFRGRPDS